MAYHDYQTRRAISGGSSSSQGMGGSRYAPSWRASSPTYQAATANTGTSTPTPSGDEVWAALAKTPGVAGMVGQSMVNKQSQGALGVGGALNPPPQVSAYYQALLGNRLRAAASIAQGQRSHALNALESRGLGQSGEVSRALMGIGQQQQLAGQEAATAVQGLQYAAYQSALDYERQRALMELGAKLAKKKGGGLFDAFANIAGPALGGFLGGLGGGNGLSQGTEVESVTWG